MWLKFTICTFLLFATSVALDLNNSLSSVVPVNYKITIHLKSDTFYSDLFDGQAEIKFKVLKPTQNIKLHLNNLVLRNISLTDEKQEYYLESLDDLDFIKNTGYLILLSTLVPGMYCLNVDYSGLFNSEKVEGLYKGTYKNENFIITNLYPTHMSKVFPCFGEPHIKSTFDLKVIYPVGYNVIANTFQKKQIETLSNNTERVQFLTSPLMNTYSLNFIISKFTCDSTERDITYRVCSRSGLENERRYALRISHFLLEFMRKTTEVSYGVGNITKLDFIAVPNFSGESIHSWGFCLSDEKNLLSSLEFSTEKNKQEIMVSIGTQIANIWFGNLVSTEDFLRTAFATYFGYIAANEVERIWKMDQLFVLEQVHSALLEDSFDEISQPLYNQVLPSISNTLQSSKGATILRMIAHVIGTENFQKSLKHFFQYFTLKNSTLDDLWNCFKIHSSQLYYNFDTFIANYIHKTGYPVLNVTLKGSEIIMSQKSFTLSPQKYYDNFDTKWYIPISYMTSKDVEYSTNANIWLSPFDDYVTIGNVVSSSDDWIIVNNLQTGYYRVLYDNHLLDRITKALKKNINVINVINRAQIIDDVFNLARSGTLSYSTVLHAVRFLKNDTDYNSWYVAFKNFKNILVRIKNSERKITLMDYIADLTTKLYQSTTISKENIESPLYGQKVVMMFSWACGSEHSQYINKSLEEFKNYKNGMNVSINLKFEIMCTAIEHSTFVESDFEFLWKKYKNANIASEQLMLLKALGCTRKSSILKKYVQILFQKCTNIRKQDTLEVLLHILQDNPIGVDAVLLYLSTNYDTVKEYFSDDGTVKFLLYSIADTITEVNQTSFLYHLNRNHIMTFEMQYFIEDLTKLVEKNLLWHKRIGSEIEEFFRIDTTSTALTETTTGYYTTSTRPVTTEAVLSSTTDTSVTKKSIDPPAHLEEEEDSSGVRLKSNSFHILCCILFCWAFVYISL